MIDSKTFRYYACVLAGVAWLAGGASAQEDASRSQEANDSTESETLASPLFKSGDATLQAFASLSATARRSIAKLDVDGRTVGLAAIVDETGLAVTKASQLLEGRMTCWLAGGREVEAEKVAHDELSDLALVRIHAPGLVPMAWAAEEATVGQWVLTTGIESVPQAAGIVSVPPRKILPKQAYIGVRLDLTASTAHIETVMEGYGADLAGLKPGDVILALNEEPMKDSEALMTALRQFREGQTVIVRVQRQEEVFEATIRMMALRPDRFGFGPSRQEQMNRMGGGISARAEDFEEAIQHDTVLQPWLCGGPLLNLDGKAIGLNIARAGRTASYALPAALVLRVVEELKAKQKMAIKQEDPAPDSLR